MKMHSYHFYTTLFLVFSSFGVSWNHFLFDYFNGWRRDRAVAS